MRAVNRQPMFTARGTHRASPSRYTYPARFHAYCDGTRILERQPPTAEQPKNVIKHVKNVENFGHSMSTLGNLKSITVHSKTLRGTLCASQKLPGSFLAIFEKSRMFMKISTFSVSPKNLSSLRDFSKTHRQTQHIHFWIAYDLSFVLKLVPCQTNTRILSYDHFSGEKS